jgi:hypothetical protein
MRIFHAAFSCAGVAMPLMLPCVAQATAINIPVLPVTSIITIQPIDVCDAIGTGCASLANLANDETAVNAVWDQAGLGFDFLPAVQFDDTTASQGFLNPTVTIAPGFPTGTPTDLAHQLMYGAGHGQSSNPTTLNVWFVDHLTRSDGVGIYGTAFIGGNGIIVPTLPNLNTGQLPALDTLAHEVGHNLGLQHVDGTSSSSPLNLMQSVGRTVPTNFCQINPNSCTPGSIATDRLLPAQIKTAQNPLFTIDLAQVTAQVDHAPGVCAVGSKICDIDFKFASSATTQSLIGFQVRSLAANSILDGTAITGSSPEGITGTGPKTSLLTPTGAAVQYSFAPGLFREGDSFDLMFSYGNCRSICGYAPPFSVEFDFSSGVTSAALFDGSGFADSQLPGSPLQIPFPLGLGFDGTPTYGLGKTVPIVACTDVEGDQTTGANSPCTFGSVPEPPAVSLFLVGLVGLGGILRCSRQHGRA